MFKNLFVLSLSTMVSVCLWAHGIDDVPETKYFKNYYFPNVESLELDEMRITALGTGLPSSRKSQAGGSWFVELGNGDKFFFDVGIGSQSNFGMLQVSYREADKVFLSHLHVDHSGDIDSLWRDHAGTLSSQ